MRFPIMGELIKQSFIHSSIIHTMLRQLCTSVNDETKIQTRIVGFELAIKSGELAIEFWDGDSDIQACSHPC